MNKRNWHIMPLIILLVFSGSWISGCGTGAEDMECPDTSFSQTNLDTLEAKNPKYVWRMCNTNDELAMDIIEIFSGEIDFKSVLPCRCSSYVASEGALAGVNYKFSNETNFPVYLDHNTATKGLIDSTEIRETPGRYTYFFSYDTSLSGRPFEIEIEREAYY